MSPRYAIYYAPDPDSALWKFGSAVLGYDATTGAEVTAVTPDGLSKEAWRQATEDPRRYGFHATLKAPFWLAKGTDEIELIGALARFAAAQPVVPLGRCSIRSIEEAFVAFSPDRQPAALAALEQTVVTRFDPFRAPLTAEDRQRRDPDRLTARQRANLDAWGYPYVLDEFRLHMTLSGRLESPHAVATSLAARWDALRVSSQLVIDRLALFRQQPGERFRIIASVPLRNPDIERDD